MVHDDPASSHFFRSALAAFLSRTLYANSAGDYMVRMEPKQGEPNETASVPEPDLCLARQPPANTQRADGACLTT
jgi:hypothetical protein